MVPESAGSEDLQLELLSANLQMDRGEVQTFLPVLASKLEALLPAQTEVQRRRGGFRGQPKVKSVVVNGGGEQLRLEAAGNGAGALLATRARISGGIVLKTEQIDLDQWIADLTRLVAAEARSSQSSRQALESLLLGEGG